jgi:hypothetical protein
VEQDIIESVRRRRNGCPVKTRLFTDITLPQFNQPVPANDYHIRRAIVDHGPGFSPLLLDRQLPIDSSFYAAYERIHYVTPSQPLTTQQERLAWNEKQMEFCASLQAVATLTDGSYRPRRETQDGVVEENAAWAYGRYDYNSNTMIASTSGSIGPKRSVFTAEMSAHRRNLNNFKVMMENHKARGIPYPPALFMFTDSLSAIEMYKPGLWNQHCPEGRHAVHQAAEIVSTYGVHVYFVFIFAHVDFAPHDFIDQLASEALGLEPQQVPLPFSFRDARRVAKAPLRKAVQNALLGNPNSFRNRLRLHLPDDFEPWNQARLLPRNLARNVYRLWTGVSPDIGGWKQRINVPCPYCNEPLQRDEGVHPLVHNILQCRGTAALVSEIGGGPPESLESFLFNTRRIIQYSGALKVLFQNIRS